MRRKMKRKRQKENTCGDAKHDVATMPPQAERGRNVGEPSLLMRRVVFPHALADAWSMRAFRCLVGVGLALVLVVPLANVARANPSSDSGVRALERALRAWQAARSWRLDFTAVNGRHARVIFEKPHAFLIDDRRNRVPHGGIVIGPVLYQRVREHWTRSSSRTVPSEFGQSTGEDVLEHVHTFAVARDRIDGQAAMRYSFRNPDLPGGVLRLWISSADGRMRRFETAATNGATTRLRLLNYDSSRNHLRPPARSFPASVGLAKNGIGRGRGRHRFEFFRIDNSSEINGAQGA